MTSRSNPQPFKPMREWVGPDGQQTIALHPSILAVSHELAEDEGAQPTLKRVLERLEAYTSGNLEMSDKTLDLVGHLDQVQRANGYDGP